MGTHGVSDLPRRVPRMGSDLAMCDSSILIRTYED